METSEGCCRAGAFANAAGTCKLGRWTHDSLVSIFDLADNEAAGPPPQRCHFAPLSCRLPGMKLPGSWLLLRYHGTSLSVFKPWDRVPPCNTGAVAAHEPHLIVGVISNWPQPRVPRRYGLETVIEGRRPGPHLIQPCRLSAWGLGMAASHALMHGSDSLPVAARPGGSASKLYPSNHQRAEPLL